MINSITTLFSLLAVLKSWLIPFVGGALALVGFVARAQPGQLPSLAPYQGTYAYQPQYGGALQLLPKDSLLVAVIGEDAYPLRRIKPDVFLNSLGDTIPFQRDEKGDVTGFRERGTFYKRRTAKITVPLASQYARRLPDGSKPHYTYAAPEFTDEPDGLVVGHLTDAGLKSERLTTMVQAIIDEQYPGVHSVLIWKKGQLVLEEYFYGYDQHRLQQMRSASKSVVSALVGAAVAREAFASEKDRVRYHFKYSDYANDDPRKETWTLEDFLTMRTGLDCDDDDSESAGNEEKVYAQPDWAKFVLDLPLTGIPGRDASYCSGAVAVLGKAIENATEMPLPKFAETALFKPLNIVDYRWNYALANTNSTFAQLYLTPRSMLKLGILYKQRGRWGEEQVLPASWVDKSLREYSKLGSKTYGYLWWHQRFEVNGKEIDAQMATGNGGQKIYILPSLDAVVVFTGSNYDSAKDSPPNELMPKYILPTLLMGRR